MRWIALALLMFTGCATAEVTVFVEKDFWTERDRYTYDPDTKARIEYRITMKGTK